jgi:hypothetical protein
MVQMAALARHPQEPVVEHQAEEASQFCMARMRA